MLLSPLTDHAVTTDKRIEQTFGDPVVQIGNEIFAFCLTVLLLHQIPSVAGHDCHDNALGGEILLVEHFVQLFQTVALVQQIVYQQYRPLKGFEHTHLTTDSCTAAEMRCES